MADDNELKPQNDLIFDEPDNPKEVTVNQETKETTVNQVAPKETTVNQVAPKETTVNQQTAESKVNENKSQKTPQENDDEEVKDPDTAEVNRKDDNLVQPGDEEKGPFKEGDIIKYMYEDWLIGGLNWLWAKGAKHIKAGATRQKYAKPKKDAENKKTKTLERFDTYKMKEKYNDKMLNNIDKKEKQLAEYNGLVDVCDKIRTGRLGETDLPDEVKAMIKAMPKKDFDKFFNPKRIAKTQDNIKSNMLAAMQFANMYAQAALLDAKMQSLNHEALANGNDAAFEAFLKEGLKKYVKAMGAAQEDGKDTYALSGKLLKMVEKAVETAHKNIDNGNFDGFEKNKRNMFLQKKKVKGEYKPNKEFDKLQDMLGNVDITKPAANLWEEALMEQDFDKANAYQFEQYRMNQNDVNARRRSLEDRRRNLENRIMNDPALKAARDAKLAQRSAKRQEMIERMRQDPNYGSQIVRARLLGGGR